MVQATHEHTVVLDRLGSVGNDIVLIEKPLLDAALRVASLVNYRDCDAFVEVYSLGVGLAMAGLLRAYGLNVLQAHVYEQPDQE